MKPNVASLSPDRDLKLLLDIIQQQPIYKGLMNKIPIKTFFSVKNWPTVQIKLHRYMIFWLHRPVLLHSKLHVDTSKSFKMSIGTIHYLISDTISVGYIIELPKNIKLEVTNSFISAIVGKKGGDPQSITDLPVTQQELLDKHLSVYLQNTTQIIACKTDLIDFLT